MELAFAFCNVFFELANTLALLYSLRKVQIKVISTAGINLESFVRSATFANGKRHFLGSGEIAIAGSGSTTELVIVALVLLDNELLMETTIKFSS